MMAGSALICRLQAPDSTMAALAPPPQPPCIACSLPGTSPPSLRAFPSKISSYPSSPPSISWSSSFSSLEPFASSLRFEDLNWRRLPDRQEFVVVRAAWTRRSRGEAAKKPNRKSWSQRTDMYMRPFLLNVFFSKRFIHAKVVHRGTSKVISVATTNAKDLRNTLPSLTDANACRAVGQLVAERSIDADVFALAYEPKKNERIEGRLSIVLDTIKEHGIIFV